MKKAIKKKLSGTKNVFKKALSRHSSNEYLIESRMAEETVLKNELHALTDQIENLKAAVVTLQDETEQKEIAIANLAREKEKMNHELLKTKRSNAHLCQQLEDERKYYLKEKEMYCHEMNECKRLKRMINSSSNNTNSDINIEEYKNEISKLRETLNQTLEANYNLSIKFLRMKNTKTCLKTELQTVKLEHERLVNDYKVRIESLTNELNAIVNERINSPISPSSKKYLQLVKQNSCLVYENLCLQLEVDTLNYKFQKIKLDQSKGETNQRLQYIHHKSGSKDKSKRGFSRDSSVNKRSSVVVNEAPEKLEKSPTVSVPSCSFSKEEVVKIYERKRTPDTPEIRIINERDDKSRKGKRKTSIKKDEIIKQSVVDKNRVSKKTSSKLTLFQVSELKTTTSSAFASAQTVTRTKSLPDILSVGSSSHRTA